MDSVDDTAYSEPSKFEVIHPSVKRDCEILKNQDLNDSTRIQNTVETSQYDDYMSSNGKPCNNMIYLPHVQDHTVSNIKIEKFDNDEYRDDLTHLACKDINKDFIVKTESPCTANDLNANSIDTENLTMIQMDNNFNNDLENGTKQTYHKVNTCNHLTNQKIDPQVLNYDVEVVMEERMIKLEDLGREKLEFSLVNWPSQHKYNLSYEVKIEDCGVKDPCDENMSSDVHLQIIDNAMIGNSCTAMVENQQSVVSESKAMGALITNTNMGIQERDPRKLGIFKGEPSNLVILPSKPKNEDIETIDSRKSDVKVFRINKKLSCNLCPFQTAHGTHLAAHIKAHAAPRSYDCDQCYYKTVKLEGIRAHRIAHSTRRDYTCDICNKSFKERGNITRHMKIHYGVKRFCCDVCKKRFISECDLKHHIRTHSGYKPFLCDICDKSFSERNNLLRHLKMHSGLKPFVCEVCKKGFLQKHHMKRHMKMHVNVGRFYCDLCMGEFKRKCSLYSHLIYCSKRSGNVQARPKQNVQTFDCNFCNSSFNSNKGLGNHLRLCGKANVTIRKDVRTNILKNVESMRKKRG